MVAKTFNALFTALVDNIMRKDCTCAAISSSGDHW